MGDISQHAGTEGDLVESHAVAAKRGLGLGAADDIIPRILVELGAGFADELVQVLEFVVTGAKLDVLPLTHRFLRSQWSSCLICDHRLSCPARSRHRKMAWLLWAGAKPRRFAGRAASQRGDRHALMDRPRDHLSLIAAGAEIPGKWGGSVDSALKSGFHGPS